jgi:hypothetical protein
LDKPFKELVNSALRKGLAESVSVPPNPIRVRPHDFGATRGGLDLNRLNQLVDELAVEDFLNKSAHDDSARH